MLVEFVRQHHGCGANPRFVQLSVRQSDGEKLKRVARGVEPFVHVPGVTTTFVEFAGK